MGLLDFLARLFGPSGGRSAPAHEPSRSQPDRQHRPRRPRRKPRLEPLRYRRHGSRDRWARAEEVDHPPYRFAQLGVRSGGFLDLSGDGNAEILRANELPVFQTPEELARWLEIPLGKLAWLIHRFSQGHRPDSEQAAHYHYRWIKKRTGGLRLVEAPKRTLKDVQGRILREILDLLSPHDDVHGFVRGRSIVTNARPHVGRRVVLKFDLANFYANVSLSRVTAIFRSVGYSREAAIWLARLTTSALPYSMPFPAGQPSALVPYLRRHLPQGAATSPALANLSAFALDVRLSGMARSFGARYTRYADDLTFSGDERFLRSLSTFVPLAQQIVRQERFHLNRIKRRVLRINQRQTVTGVVVNEKPNVGRAEYDRLKAILHNCRRHGPQAQNRDGHADFQAHLRGRIDHVMQLNPERGAKLLEAFGRIVW